MKAQIFFVEAKIISMNGDRVDRATHFTRVKRKVPVFQAGDISKGARFI